VGSYKILIQKASLNGEMYVARDIAGNLVTDAHMIIQIVFNLIANAAKFTNAGSIRVLVMWVPERNFESFETV